MTAAELEAELRETNEKLQQWIKACDDYLSEPKKAKFDIFLPFDRFSF